MTLSLRTISEHRSFEAACLGIVESRPFVSPKQDELRPVLLVFACNAQVFRPFTANIFEKRQLELHYYSSGTRPESMPVGLLKSAGYQLASQVVPGREGHDELGLPTREPDKIIGTFYLESAFSLEPMVGPESDLCDFIMLPTREQLEANAAALDNRSIVMHLMRTGRSKVPAELLRYFGALACLWAGYIDRRVHAPIIQEPAFFAHAFYDAIEKGVVVASSELNPTNPNERPGGYGWRSEKAFPERSPSTRAYGLEALGYAPLAWVNRATEDQMQELLAESLKSYSVAAAVANKVELPEGL